MAGSLQGQERAQVTGTDMQRPGMGNGLLGWAEPCQTLSKTSLGSGLLATAPPHDFFWREAGNSTKK